MRFLIKTQRFISGRFSPTPLRLPTQTRLFAFPERLITHPRHEAPRSATSATRSDMLNDVPTPHVTPIKGHGAEAGKVRLESPPTPARRLPRREVGALNLTLSLHPPTVRSASEASTALPSTNRPRSSPSRPSRSSTTAAKFPITSSRLGRSRASSEDPSASTTTSSRRCSST